MTHAHPARHPARRTARLSAAICALVLLSASALADAACRPNTCWQQYTNCRAQGVPLDECYTRYELCLYRHGCPVP